METWLTELNVPRAKHKWLREIFEKMGSDPTADTYVKPADGDVWEFMGRIRTWLVDTKRRGIPV